MDNNDDVRGKLQDDEVNAEYEEDMKQLQEMKALGMTLSPKQEKFLEIQARVFAAAEDYEKGKITEEQSYSQMMDLLKEFKQLTQDDEKDTRKVVPVNWQFLVHPTTASLSAISWTSTYLQTQLYANLCLSFTDDKDAQDRRKFIMQQLESLNIPHELTGKDDLLLKITSNTKCPDNERANVSFCAELYTKVLEVGKGEKSEACYETRLEMLDQATQKRLEALDFFISVNRELVIVTW